MTATKRARAALAVSTAAMLVLSACSGAGQDAGSSGPSSRPSTPSAGAAPPTVASYVALGDSYTSAPYVRLTDVAGGCLRSSNNYPSVLAQRLDLSGSDFSDVSCAGATTPDLSAPQNTFAQQTVPAQLDAVRRDTALVTLGIGGNDFGLFGDLAGSCVFPRGDGPACGEVDVDRAKQSVPRIGTRIARALRAIEAKAPQARVVLVGYPRIVDAAKSCPDVLPLDAAARRDLEDVNRSLNQAMRKAARRTGADFVDMFAAGTGHDVCAGDEAWVNGVKTDTERAAALHPFAAEQRAVAAKVLALLD